MYDSVSVATPESSGDESSGSKQEDLRDEHVRNSGSSSPASAAVSEQQLTSRIESSGTQDMDKKAEVELVRDNSQSHTSSQSQQHQDPSQLPIFSVSTVNEFVIYCMLFYWVCTLVFIMFVLVSKVNCLTKNVI